MISEILPKTDSAYERLKCKYSSISTSKQCENTISFIDREWAQTLCKTISSYHPKNASIPNLVQEYASLCFCKTHRRLMTESHAAFWRTQLHRWTAELQDMFNEAMNETKNAFQAEHLDSEMSFLESLGLADLSISSREKTPKLPGCYPSSQTSTQESVDGGQAQTNETEQFLTLVLDRYQRLILRHSIDVKSDIEDQSSETYFKPYKSPTSTTALLDLIRAPLTVSQSKPGFVYAYMRNTDRAEDSSHVKIGHTTRLITERFEEWTSTCGHEPVLVYPTTGHWVEDLPSMHTETMLVPNAGRVEKLVHRELERAGKRKHDHYCVMTSRTCRVVHGEWFEIDRAEATNIIKYWISWMITHDPYDEDGSLRPDIILSMFKPSTDRDLTAEAIDFQHDSKGKPWHKKQHGQAFQMSPSELSDTVSPQREEPYQPSHKISICGGRKTSSATRPDLDSGQQELDIKDCPAPQTLPSPGGNVFPSIELDNNLLTGSPFSGSSNLLRIPKKTSRRATNVQSSHPTGTNHAPSDRRHNSWSGELQGTPEQRRSSRKFTPTRLRKGDSIDRPIDDID